MYQIFIIETLTTQASTWRAWQTFSRDWRMMKVSSRNITGGCGWTSEQNSWPAVMRTVWRKNSVWLNIPGMMNWWGVRTAQLTSIPHLRCFWQLLLLLCRDTCCNIIRHHFKELTMYSYSIYSNAISIINLLLSVKVCMVHAPFPLNNLKSFIQE